MKSRLPLLIAVCLSVAALWLVATRLRLDPDVAHLLPEGGDGAALRQYARAFGGGDIGMVLLRGADPVRVRDAAQPATEALASCPGVRAALHRLALEPASDPSLAWAFADARAADELQAALTADGMRQRLADTRALLLAPGSGGVAPQLQLDPLRLREIPMQGRGRIAAGANAADAGLFAAGSGAFIADQGRVRLILFAPGGQALRGSDAREITDAVHRCIEPVRQRFPDVRMEVTGGHAIAAATEALIRSDLRLSATASLLLAALAFAITFRRLRALVAVMPPLALGTLWTAALASLWFEQLSSISIAFVSVVVGVGVDTGVHVYAALLDARRRGLPPHEAALEAVRNTAKPTLVAALTAAAAFGSLALSSIRALQQLGVLCAVGELLTAIAILLVTPTLGAWLERGTPPAATTPWWTGPLDRTTRSRFARLALFLAFAAPVLSLIIAGPPVLSDALVAIRPATIAPIKTLDETFAWFGGGSRQWVVLVADPDLGRARHRTDAIHARLEESRELVLDFDDLTRFAPSPETQRERLAARDAIDLPSRVGELRAALADSGFAPDRFEPAFRWMASPSREVHDTLENPGDAAQLLRARFVARDGEMWLVATYVRPRPGKERLLEAALAGADPAATITGYWRFDGALRTSLARDLPRIGAVAALLVMLAMALALRRWREVAIAAATLAFEAVWLLAIVRFLRIPLHAYDVLVLPVLLGVTVDEAMFLLHRARSGGMRAAIAREGPSLVATASTTAAGFGALLVCRYQGLADMGGVGLAGVLIGLVAALLVVPILGRRRAIDTGSP